MVITSAAQVALTPGGNPFAPEIPLLIIPVAPVVLNVIFDKPSLKHIVGELAPDPAELSAVLVPTVMVPTAFSIPQPPVKGMLYSKIPSSVGVPLIVMVLLAQDAVTPDGKSLTVPIPVAPVVVCVIAVNGVLIHKLGVEDGAETELSFTVMVPVALKGQAPNKGME